MSDEQATTRRDVIAEQFAQHEEQQQVETPVETPEAPVEAPVEVKAEDDKPGRTANRLRDEKGRLLPGKKEEPVEQPVETAPQAPPPNPYESLRPSSWKKEMWPIWDKVTRGQALTPEEAKKYAEYDNNRFADYSKGVSVYKTEAESARQLQEAIAPFLPTLQQHGLQPTQWIQNLGRAHHTLALGTPEQKLQTFQKLAADYGVPLQALVGQPGQVDPLMQTITPLYEQVRQLQGQFQTYQQQTQQQQQAEMQRTLSDFAAQHEHFEAVRQTMGQLLDSGLAQDLQTAYDTALKLPQHSDIAEAVAQQQAAEAERKKVEEAAAAAARARAKTTSTRSATPSGTGTSSGAKDRRSIIAEQIEAMSGRV